MFDALYTNGLFSVKIQRFIDAIANVSRFHRKTQNYSEILFIVKLIVNSILEWAFHLGDVTSIDFLIDTNKFTVDKMKEVLKTASGKEKEKISRIIKFGETEIEKLPKRTEKWYSLYTDFCNKILPKLMEEKIVYEDAEIQKFKKEFLHIDDFGEELMAKIVEIISGDIGEKEILDL